MISEPLLGFRPEFPILATSRYLSTEDTELGAVFAAIDEILETKAWRRWVDRPVVVT